MTALGMKCVDAIEWEGILLSAFSNVLLYVKPLALSYIYILCHSQMLVVLNVMQIAK
jgi:hypothetical protein